MEPTLIPGLSDDVAELCLGRVTWSRFRIVSQVSRRWKLFYKSDRCFSIRKLTGKVEQFLCVVMDNPSSTYVHGEIFDASGNKLGLIPSVPGPLKDGFRVERLGGGKIMLIGGYTGGILFAIHTSPIFALSNVYEFDPASNRWKELAPMNKPRHNFASAEVDGLVYVIRGFSRDGATLYNGEVYNPKTNQWRDFDCPNRPQWCTFAFSFGSKLNVVGGGSSFIDIYDPKTETWERQNLGQSWVGYSYTVLRNKVYFVDICWSEYLRVFDPHDHSWSMVRLPPNYQGLMYKLDTWNNKVLLLSWHRGGVTLMYDSDEEEGSKWTVFDQIEPSARPLASVIINF